jgi:hypothetical protein
MKPKPEHIYHDKPRDAAYREPITIQHEFPNQFRSSGGVPGGVPDTMKE